MSTTKPILLASILALGTALPLSGWAQVAMDHSKMNLAQAPPMTDGEIKKIDLTTGKVTIQHGEIKNVDMLGMTMVLTAKDKSILGNVKPGDKLMVTDIQLAS